MESAGVEEREIIAVRLAEGDNPTGIGKELRRHHSSVIAEIRRNSVSGTYYPARAQAKADSRRSESKSSWKMEDPRLAEYVKSSLKRRWSPEQISGRMKRTILTTSRCESVIKRFTVGLKTISSMAVRGEPSFAKVGENVMELAKNVAT